VNYAIAKKMTQLADTLETLKVRVREAMAGEMAKAVSEAVREVLVAVLCEQFTTAATNFYRQAEHGEYDRDSWEEDYPRRGFKDVVSPAVPAIPTAAAVAVGVHIGRWWFRRQGSLPVSLGLGALATVFGLSGGVTTRSILAALSSGVDLMTADTDLAR
jgi:hypothetical protein